MKELTLRTEEKLAKKRRLKNIKFGLTSLNVGITVTKLFSLRPKGRLSAEFTPGLSTCYFFASSVCKLFRVSLTIIDPGYHVILLSYHPHFDSDSQTVPRKYPHRIDLLTRTIYQTMQN